MVHGCWLEKNLSRGAGVEVLSCRHVLGTRACGAHAQLRCRLQEILASRRVGCVKQWDAESWVQWLRQFLARRESTVWDAWRDAGARKSCRQVAEMLRGLR